MRVALFLLALGCCARAAGAADQEFLAPHFVNVEISRSGGEWFAEYSFDRPVAAWFFPRSSVARAGEQPWRPQSWQIETAGVRLLRRGAYDVLAPSRGKLPDKIRVRFRPFTADLVDDYSPALGFTDGGIALLSAQFDVLPLQSVREAAGLPSDLNNTLVAETHVTMRFRDGARVTEHEAGFATYALFGPTKRVETPDVVTVFDPQLPQWIQASLAQSVIDLLARYSTQLGPLPAGKPTVMVAWGGPTPGIVGRIGGALRGQIVMKYEGEGMLTESPQQRAEGMWFVAHEAAHFWLGQTVGYDYARESWITEGGADLLAVRAIAALDSSYDWRAELDRAIGDCVNLTRRRGVATARERNEHRAYYACGVVFGLVVEGASGAPFHNFVRRLIDENRADGVVTRADWLATLDAISRDTTLSRDIARLLDRGSPDPAQFITALFERAGVAYRLDEQKSPRMK